MIVYTAERVLLVAPYICHATKAGQQHLGYMGVSREVWRRSSGRLGLGAAVLFFGTALASMLVAC